MSEGQRGYEKRLIRPEMTVRQIASDFPAARDVFRRQGEAEHSGRFGHFEPLGHFARRRNIPLPVLLEELRQATGVREPHFVDHVLCGSALVLIASLLHVGLVAADILDAQRQSLKEQNDELDRRRRDAEEASNRKTRLMASVSHDMRTPVHTINLMAELLCHATDDPDLTVQRRTRS